MERYIVPLVLVGRGSRAGARTTASGTRRRCNDPTHHRRPERRLRLRRISRSTLYAAGSLGRYACPNGFFRLPQDPLQLFDGLRGSFSAEHLIGSGVVVKSDNGTLALHPALTSRNSILLRRDRPRTTGPLTSGPAAQASGGYGRSLPYSETTGQQHYCATEQSTARGILDGGCSDPVIARHTGHPAGRARSIFRRQLDQYCQQFGIQRHVSGQALDDWFFDFSGDANEEPRSGPSLILVGWSIADLELARSPELAAIQDHFSRIDHQMGIPFAEEQIWTATNDDIERLRFALAHGDYFDVVRVFADSVADNSTELVPIGSATPVTYPAPQSYAEARLNWETSQKQSASSEQRKQAWDHLHDFHERDVIAPLWRMAMDATDALDRARILAVIDLSRLAHPQRE